jgi:ABC-2 type transport system ATP-binding protein
MLHVSDACRRFGAFTVFSDVGFDVLPGEACALVGSNGSGKSTLLRCIVGADRLDDGTITFGMEPSGAEPVDESAPTFRAAVASVLDDHAVFPHLSVREHLELIASAHGVHHSSSAAGTVLDAIGLTGAADQLPGTLSSGQRRRLALGSAFVRPRSMVVLDEPEQHLDATGRRWLADTLVAEKAAGVSVVLASHDEDLVAAVADQRIDADAWR